MSYCYEKGIPHSVFLDWDPVDRAKALAWQLEVGERCSLCGTAQWEWDENPNAYTPEEHMCMGCYRKQSYTNSLDGSQPGIRVELERSTAQRLAQREIDARKMSQRRRKLKAKETEGT